ncbi:hypothetical protein [Saccharopolyspora cebuensis]|uniref:Uncharacterized protein n=1 Tax=Saccharopolyspora cebuensis TaxID=418759 RepID=A0ABV4CS46_9PSEU
MPEPGRPEVRIPAALAGSPGGLPARCVRHGAQRARSVDFALQSKVEVQGSRLLSGNLLGAAGRIGERARAVRVTQVRGWPLCRACARRRALLFGASLVAFWGGAVLLVGALVGRWVTGQPSGVLGAALVLGFFAMLAAAVPFALGSLPRVTRARTSADGSEVVISDPHPAFVAALAGSP